MNPLDLMALTLIEAELYALCCDDYGAALDWMGGVDAMWRAVAAGNYWL